MKKRGLHFRAMAVALLLLPGMIMAQNYNNRHEFKTDYERSAHTAAVELQSGKLVEGGTIENLNITGEKSVELGIVDPSSGTLSVHPLYYSYPGLDHRAADLIESLSDPDFVVCAAKLGGSGSNDMVNIFKTNPSTGAVPWSILYKSGNGHQTPSAIARDQNKNYYVLGQARFSNNNYMYLIKITDAGVPQWERYYLAGAQTDLLDGIDLIFDGSSIVITGNLSVSTFFPNENGIIISKINPLNGAVIDTRHLQHLNGNKRIKVRDLELINGNYVMVGEYLPSPIGIATPDLGFMVSYSSVLNVNSTRIYGDGNGKDVVVTGVEQGFLGSMYMSFDLGTSNPSYFIPGIMHTNFNGVFLSSELFKIKRYLGTNGLVNVDNLNAYMVKGSVDASTTVKPRLSLIGQKVPLAADPTTCSAMFELKNEEVKYKSVHVPLGVKKDKTDNKISLKVNKVEGETVDCNGNNIASFRKAAPTGIDGVIEATSFEVYPNPSHGQFTVQLSEEQVETFQQGEIINLMGETVHNFTINSATISVDLSEQVPGVYLLRMKSSNGTVSKIQRIVTK